MNREIKFRAWDKERNMFVPYGEIIFKDYGDTSIQVLPNCIEYIGDKVHNGEPQYSRFDVQQFTGLKDREAKEIYEGDIILYKGAKGVVFYDDNSAMFMVNFELLRSVYSFDSIDEDFSVIGNIHDNPELCSK